MLYDKNIIDSVLENSEKENLVLINSPFVKQNFKLIFKKIQEAKKLIKNNYTFFDYWRFVNGVTKKEWTDKKIIKDFKRTPAKKRMFIDDKYKNKLDKVKTMLSIYSNTEAYILKSLLKN